MVEDKNSVSIAKSKKEVCLLCLGNFSKYFTVNSMNKGFFYDFCISYETNDVRYHKYS